MKKVLGSAVAGLIALAIALVAMVAMQPAHVHVERSVIVQAEPVDLWPYVSDLRGFVRWSPWEDRDPDQVTEFSEPSSGVGAWYTWHGNDDVGRGKMTITAIDEHRKVVQDLEFIEPFESKAEVALILEPVADGTKVTWSFDTVNGFMAKAFSMLMDMDAMLGGDFETGLARLAVIAQKDAKQRVEFEEAAAREALERATAEEAPSAE